MSSEIRNLLAAAQEAESRGDKHHAIARLQQATEFYRSRRMERRAAQMERHIERLEGKAVQVPLDPIRDGGLDAFDEDDAAVSHVIDDSPFAPADDGLGFGDELLDGVGLRPAAFERGPQRADPALEAWCSFCCRPGAEVGSLVAGPAGAFICAGCVTSSAALVSGMPVPVVAQAPVPAPARTATLLPAQSSALDDWEQLCPRLALAIGPEGVGKTFLLEQLARPSSRPFIGTDAVFVTLDVTSPMTLDEEAALLRWLDGAPSRRAMLAVRAALPQPALVLKGETRDTPVYDTASLVAVSGQSLSARLLSRVDAVLAISPADQAALRTLAQSLTEAKGITLPHGVLDALLAVAERSGQPTRELAALIARLPAGAYRP